LPNTSCSRSAEDLLARCLNGERPPLDPRLPAECSRELLRIFVEGLSDRFEPALCDIYADVFSQAIPGHDPRELAARYRRVRRPRRCQADPDTVFVLSRVTIGADVAVTSVLLDAAKKRFPKAAIVLAGSSKVHELYAADPRITPLEVAYPRTGSLAERLADHPRLRAQLSQPRSIVIDPDSRLTQLGLLPVCEEENYYFFESRAYGGESDAPLSELTRRWAFETFGVEDARPYIAPSPVDEQPDVAISLGIGENPAKRIADPFEEQLLAELIARGRTIYIDKGAGGEETARVERAIAKANAGDRIRWWQGAFAPFAAAIARSRLYIGYDSAGQHVAAACGVPLITVFAGYPCDRMFHRWHPTGPARIDVIKVTNQTPGEVLSALHPLL
jgi:ADP-heptose:LPS heptosyltransferase